ncbi:hypothetical protein IEQ34_009451 [Dendrobium chrysotoxum]|uniref:R13L1/DRL21-like LRR repeat region domain-containing protein n=1 Tax=Dendrobium chrysotoxum TaxID=161865 RepID=A0AAV7GYT1_DENCH|nr:hypothetical protein IEQ34_009451 [Dendrobium chrysotoxum]
MILPDNYISWIHGIGKLNSLHELNLFDLRNDIGINCLEDVKDSKEVCSAKLCDKRRFTHLTLRWSYTNSWNII